MLTIVDLLADFAGRGIHKLAWREVHQDNVSPNEYVLISLFPARETNHGNEVGEHRSNKRNLNETVSLVVFMI